LLDACQGYHEGDSCSIELGPIGGTGTCTALGEELACITTNGFPGGPPGDGPDDLPDIPDDGVLQPIDGGGGGFLGGTENPIYVPCHVQFEGQTWWYVGIRFKGQSSLQSTWRSGNGKLPLRLDFDQFEDEYPEIDNQRFYGFQDLSLGSNWSDYSLLREKVGHDIFRAAGVPAPRTAFYRVYVDFGEGSKYFGLYTMTEIPDDPMFESQFGGDGGNLYKPRSNWVTFAEDEFDKETNKADADWSDVQAAIAALHADRTDAAIWRAGLEAVFNVDVFLHWLAINTVVVNWDTYGQMAQNYYVYADSGDAGRLNWIPWDLNLSLGSSLGGGGAGMGAVSLDLDEVGDNWPLIRYLADDPVYWSSYVGYVRDTIESAFALESAQARFQAAHDLIAPYVVGPDGEQPGYTHLPDAQAFDDSLQELFDHVVQRQDAAQEFLSTYEDSSPEPSAAGVLWINEFMADNASVIEDPDDPGAFEDWVEVYNAGDSTINMGGMYLTDDLENPTKWRIPFGVTVPAGSYLLFWADEQQEQGSTHTNFKLAAAGEAIGLYDTDANGNQVIDALTLEQQTPDVSYGRFPDGEMDLQPFVEPTPGQANGPD
jgi:hypothetical protein